MKKFIDIFSLSPDKGLEVQLLFWLGIILPIFSAVLLGIPVWSEYSIEFNELAYKKFLEVSVLPIGIASLAIPLGVLIGRLHGTKQTALQIKNSEQDNRTKLYLSHFDHFCTHINFVEGLLIDRFTEILPDENKLILNKLAMYRLIYPQNSLVDGVKSTGTHLDKFAYNSMKGLSDSYSRFLGSNEDTFAENLCSLEGEFLHIQLGCFRCQKTRESIFIKNKHEKRNNEFDFLFGISPELSHYFPQVEFFLELLAGIESFEFNDPDKMHADKILNRLKMPHSCKPHEVNELKVMWKNLENT